MKKWMMIVALWAGLGGAVWWVLDGMTGEDAAGFLEFEDKDTIALGNQIYQAQCATCHGANLEGQPDWQVQDDEGYLPAPPHDETGHTWHHPDAQLMAITKLGTAEIVGSGYQSRMGGFGDILSDNDISAVLAYIKSTWPADVVETHNQINRDSE